MNKLNRAEHTLAGSVEKALKGFEIAMTKVKAKIEAKTAADEATITTDQAKIKLDHAAKNEKTANAAAVESERELKASKKKVSVAEERLVEANVGGSAGAIAESEVAINTKER